jgi:hypothetical protein
MQVAARLVRQQRVASNLHGLGGGGRALQPQPRADRPRVHARAVAERLVLAVRHHRQPVGGAAQHRAAHHLGRLHGEGVVGAGDRARLLERVVVARRLAAHALRERSDHIDPAGRLAFGAGVNLAHERRAVQRRLGVGHTADAGEPACHRRRAARLQRLLVALPQVAQMHMDVHQPWRDPAARAVNHRLARVGRERVAQFGDAPLAQPQVAPHIQRLRRVEQASIPQQVAIHSRLYQSRV